MKGVKETIVQIQMNVKGIRFACASNEPQVVKVSKKGEGVVTAGDLELTESVTVIDPKAEIATITDSKTSFDMELVVERGVGYRTADEELRSEVGRLPLHADFSPVERVTFSIEKTRKGEKLDLDQVNLEILTDGSIDPQEALGKAAEILSAAFARLMDMTGVEEEPMPVAEVEESGSDDVEAKEWLVEDLPISKRAKSRLLEAEMTKLGDIAEKSKEDLLEIKGFGEAALEEVVEVLDEYGLSLKE
jgi:DNA-directed RNA polymerase subunit alpha